MAAPRRLLLPSEAVSGIFGDDAEVGFACKAGACVSFCADVSDAVEGDTHVVKIVGNLAQQDAACEDIFVELCATFGRESSDHCVLLLVIPSKMVIDVERACYAVRSSNKVYVGISSITNSKDHIVELRGTQKEIMSAVRTADEVVQNNARLDKCNEADFPLELTQSTGCESNGDVVMREDSGKVSLSEGEDCSVQWLFAPEIDVRELDTVDYRRRQRLL